MQQRLSKLEAAQRLGVSPSVPHLHAAGTGVSFESEAARDNYVAQQVVTTTLPGGRARRWHWVTLITEEQAQHYFQACEASPSCIHKSHERTGRVRISE